MAPGLPLYNEPVTLRYSGPLDRDALERSFAELQRRHAIWRTTFASVDGEVVQAIHETLPITMPFSDLSALDPDQRAAQAARLATADARRAFDLNVGPLLRMRLVKFGVEDHRVYLTMHHMVFDGLSLSRVILPELAALYHAFSRGLSSPLPEPRYQYADYVFWQQQLPVQGLLSPQMDYWRTRLSGDLPVVDLPFDRTAPQVRSFRGANETFTLPPGTVSALKNACAAEGVTPYMFLLAAFKTLLHRYAGQQDLLIGGITSARRRPEFERLMGCFTNTVALRTQPNPEMPFREYLSEVKDAVLGALSANDVPLEQVVREIHPRREFGSMPLFQVLFAMQPSSPDVPDWKVTHLDTFTGLSKFDLYVEMQDDAGTLSGFFQYSSELFDASTIRRMIGHLEMVLSGVLADLSRKLSSIDILTAGERQLLDSWRGPRRPIRQATIPQLFEEQVQITPNAIAVSSDGGEISYDQLNQEANRLARRLRDVGAKPDTLVALCIRRSPEMIAALMAVLKSGAAYLPLDPTLPADRLRSICQDSGASIVLLELGQEKIFEPTGATLVHIHEGSGPATNLGLIAQPHHLAYVLYTSGSTGQPKGVETPHSAVINLLDSRRGEPGYSRCESTLSLAAITFDMAAFEIYVPLLSGGCLTIVSREDARDATRLIEIIRHAAPDLICATPTTWRALIEAGWRGDGKLKIMSGGEALTRELAEQLLPRCAVLWNAYGPTETTMYSALHQVNSGYGPVPVGRAIANTQLYVLDQEGRLLPPGVRGELYIGGEGLARGYRARPELTHQRFLEVDSLGRLYRTGDLARWHADGTLEWTGRTDNQVKIRGFRIETEEVEAALLDHPGVQAAAVRAWPDPSGSSSWLSAYVVAPDRPKLREFLESKLPDYMIPANFIWETSLPLSSNGKVDRAKLKKPETLPETSGGFLAPRSDIEHRLASIWETLLGQNNLSIRDNFFDLGGHSLLSTQLLRMVQSKFGVKLSLADVFRAPTIEKFAQLVRDGRSTWNVTPLIPIQKEGARTPFYWIDVGPWCRALASHMGPERPLFGLSIEETDDLPQNPSMEEIAVCLAKKLRAAQPEGPYILGGWCASGLMAYALARHLQDSGFEVPLVVMLEGYNPARVFSQSRRFQLAGRMRYHIRNMMTGTWRHKIKYAFERVDALLKRFRRVPPVENEVLQALFSYNPPSYDGAVLLLETELSPAQCDIVSTWSGLLTGPVDHRRVPGNHVSVLLEPNIQTLAEQINDALAKLDGEQEMEAVSYSRKAAG
jgi:amino acid adenylation domain-containing protein